VTINPLDQGFLPFRGHPIACLQALNQAVHVGLDSIDLLTPTIIGGLQLVDTTRLLPYQSF